ncbi:MAG: hypothetical protein M3341_00925 [Actinomycetota bacterium]|jgi:hypothetical protein|nr:hypothetical protein [Actinomycetota bacterium]
MVEIRILVALEDDYRAYRETIASALRILRPGAEVATSGPDTLEEEVASLDPHLVICSVPEDAVPVSTLAWVQLSLDPIKPTVICIGGRHFVRENPLRRASARA